MNVTVQEREKAAARREVVVRFARLAEMPAALNAARKITQQPAAEVVIRRVALPTCTQRGAVDHERLYSELKALQAQTQAAELPARIEACYRTRSQTA